MINTAQIKQNLIQRFEILQNQYPDCLWLTECIEMNQQQSMTEEIRLKLEGNAGHSLFSKN